MTREEAIEVIKAKADYLESDKRFRAAVETIIPELTESEDERVRKKIIGCLRLKKEEGKEFFGSEPIDNCIAYLEKQKEQKSAEVDERMKNDKHFLSICQHLGTLISESKNDEAIESIDKDYRWLCEFYRKSRSASVEENYKEPAEWSEEDERIRKAILGFITPDKGGTKYSSYAELVEWSDWLKSLRPSWKPSEVCYGVKGDPDPAGTSDLEEAAEKYADKHGFRVPYDGSNNYYDDVDVKASKEGFIAGAEWQKKQMMKDAVEAEITVGRLPDDWSLAYNPDELHRALLKFKSGDKVKIIIVKQ